MSGMGEDDRAVDESGVMPEAHVALDAAQATAATGIAAAIVAAAAVLSTAVRRERTSTTRLLCGSRCRGGILTTSIRPRARPKQSAGRLPGRRSSALTCPPRLSLRLWRRLRTTNLTERSHAECGGERRGIARLPGRD